MCFIRSWCFGFFAMSMEAISHTRVSSLSSLRSQMASLQASVAAKYSASGHRVTVGCFRDFHEIAPPLSVDTYPDVELHR
ncbi:hypothetical protein BDZ91DRAFT_746961 [Kalaharituber pfeilii]|nr:hypothetical protein BDZ91DRAFT_746961 [Kalaharituber pfeilii]